MGKQSDASFADTTAARLIAVCLALLIAIILVVNYKQDVVQMFSDAPDSAISAGESETSSENNANPALAACLAQRIGDVERMREEGILTESQYSSFRANAEELCVQQNPG